eukprot:CAMPEP_0172483492 /NCGR_PEP_ID=MMETSP1066-20121228/10503_1 /TAXON_ID=671091 /ORGANISM="Coscinodiscus wailesii, Strain CCMP2513" /LENGTH=166 /DNA_ID=CAMNT_0013247397 /DNA_START=164 /DNA_END=664 /DNA_ORIENTATION=+
MPNTGSDIAPPSHHTHVKTQNRNFTAVAAIRSVDNSNDNKTNAVETAVKMVISSDAERMKKEIMLDEDLHRRLEVFQSLFMDAMQCIEDCKESLDTKHFEEESIAAKDAVEEACTVIKDILYELNLEEKEAGIKGGDRRSCRVRKENGLKVEQLRRELEQVLGSEK